MPITFFSRLAPFKHAALDRPQLDVNGADQTIDMRRRTFVIWIKSLRRLKLGNEEVKHAALQWTDWAQAIADGVPDDELPVEPIPIAMKMPGLTNWEWPTDSTADRSLDTAEAPVAETPQWPQNLSVSSVAQSSADISFSTTAMEDDQSLEQPDALTIVGLSPNTTRSGDEQD